jgi:hypothetical protein
MALSSLTCQRMSPERRLTPPIDLTWMEYVAQGAVIKNHDFAEVWLDLSKIFDVGPVAEGAVLPVISPDKVLALDLEPVDDGIGIFLH